MQRQFKQLPYFGIKADTQGRVRKGICAVFGNVDSWGDRIQFGAFAKTISEGKARVKHLFNHDFSDIPTAVVTELKEIGRDELPPEVLAYAPEATGGLMVAREYLNSQKGNDILEALDKGAITEMSFGYDIIRSGETVEDEKHIRELFELKLFDTSDVLWGMNAATVATGAKSAMPVGVIAQNLQAIANEIKAGRRNAGSDMELIKSMHDSLVSLGFEACQPIEDAKNDEPEPSLQDTSLDLLKLKAKRLNLSSAITLTN